MLFYCWACVADNDTALNQQRVKSMCLLGTLNVRKFKSTKKPSAQVFEVRNYLRKCVRAQVLAQVPKCASAAVCKCASTCMSALVHK